MKVMSIISPAIARDHVKPAAARQTSSTPATATTAEKTASVAAKSAVPPGLERVLERLQSMSSESLNRGQANALQHIENNIARYRDHHGIVAPATLPTDPTTTPAEAPEAPVAVAPTTSETPLATTADSIPTAVAPVATPIESPIAAPPEAPVAPVTETGEVSADAPVDVSVAVPVATPISPEPDLMAVAAAIAAPPEVSLVELIPPAGSLIDVQA